MSIGEEIEHKGSVKWVMKEREKVPSKVIKNINISVQREVISQSSQIEGNDCTERKWKWENPVLFQDQDIHKAAHFPPWLSYDCSHSRFAVFYASGVSFRLDGVHSIY